METGRKDFIDIWPLELSFSGLSENEVLTYVLLIVLLNSDVFVSFDQHQSKFLFDLWKGIYAHQISKTQKRELQILWTL